MIIEPNIRGFVSSTAHPLGCAADVEEQIERVRCERWSGGPARVLVLGASGGYGLAARVACAFGFGAATIGVSLDRPPTAKRTASPGWYRNQAFERAARREGIWSRTIQGDAFSDETKVAVIRALEPEARIDLLIYSIAAPARIHPRTGVTHHSVLKPIGAACTGKTVDPREGIVSLATVEPATAEEIASTVAVMGGEDWELWIEALLSANALAPGAKTVAFSYAGPRAIRAIYRDGTIGAAKKDLESSAEKIQARLSPVNGSALVSFNQAVVTQASCAVPFIPLYLMLLGKVMKERALHESCVENAIRLLQAHLYHRSFDGASLRLDDREMKEEIQRELDRRLAVVDSTNLRALADVAGYERAFLGLFGFGFDCVDYQRDADPCGSQD